MSLSMHSTFPNLPFDVFRLILETSAWSDHRIAAKLSLVSKLVRECTESMLYYCVVLKTTSQVNDFANTVLVRRDRDAADGKPAFFPLTVKRLCLGNFGNTHECIVMPSVLGIILTACTGIQRLAVWSPFVNHDIARMLQEGTIRPTHISSMDNRMTPRAYGRSVTHFHVLWQPVVTIELSEWEVVLKHCPEITHLQVTISMLWGLSHDLPRKLAHLFDGLPPSISLLIVNVRTFEAIPRGIAWFGSQAAKLYDAGRLVILRPRDLRTDSVTAERDEFGIHHYSRYKCDLFSDWGFQGAATVESWEMAEMCAKKRRAQVATRVAELESRRAAIS